MGHLYKDFPLLTKTNTCNKWNTSSAEGDQPQVDHSNEADEMDIDAYGSRLASITLKKHGEAPLRPPSPSLTRSKAAAGVALSSVMSNPIPCFVSINSTSSHKDNSKGTW